MTTTISIKKIIDVSSILPTPAQGRRNFSNAIIIQKGNTASIKSYSSSDEVLQDQGSNSEAYKCSLKYFAGGFRGIKPTSLFIGTINSAGLTSSTQGYFTSGDASANLTDFQAISDGEFNISKDGSSVQAVSNIDFTSATSLSDVASILQSAIRLAGDLFRQIIVTYTSNTFVFTSETYGSDSAIAITPISGGSGTNLLGVDYLNGGSSTAGTDGTLSDAISDIISDNRYYHLILSNQWTDQEKLEWSSVIEASVRISYFLWIIVTTSIIANNSLDTDTNSIARILFDRKVNKTAETFDFTDADRKQASFPSYFGVVDFTSARPLGNLSYKQFPNISPTNLDDSQFDNLTSKNVNFYSTYGETGRVIAYKGRVPSGQEIKTIIASDYLDYNITYDIFDLMVTLPDLGYNNDDFAKLRQALSITPIAALNANIISAGTDPDTGEVYRSGFKIILPRPETISQQDKADGVIKDIQIILLYKEGAIKFVITNTLKLA